MIARRAAARNEKRRGELFKNIFPVE